MCCQSLPQQPETQPAVCKTDQFSRTIMDDDEMSNSSEASSSRDNRGLAGLGVLGISKKAATTLFLLAFFDSFIIWVHCVSQKEIDQHLTMGMQLLASGQYSDALSHFHSAIDADPNNYMSYYKRATVWMALSRPKPALADLDKVLTMKPDFAVSRVKRGTLLMKMGRLDEAHIDLEKALTKDPGNDEAAQAYTMIEPIKETLWQIDDLMKYRNYQPAIDKITEIIEQVPWDPYLREQRADAYLGMGNTVYAISDIKSMVKLTNDNTAGYYKLASLYYQLGEAEEALMEIRECLKLDPEHKECYPMYKSLKKVAKAVVGAQEAQNNQDWEECITSAQKILKNEPKVQRVRFHGHDKLCHCKLSSNQYDATEVRKSCTEALKILEEPRIFCDRADAYLNDELYDEAVNDFRKALEIDENFQRAKEGLETAQKRQKMASKRDYYKILGVKRNAGKREVNKAYRKLAQKWHPDNFQDETEKKKAEKKFMDIAAAKEVLTDDEKRQQFDNGEDPLDPEEQARSGNPFQGGNYHFHHPFQGGGGPFGGGGGHSFKFHFN